MYTCIHISYKKCITWPVIYRVHYGEISSRGQCEFEPKNNARRKEVFVIKCRLYRRFAMRVGQSFHAFLRKRFVAERCTLYRKSVIKRFHFI